MSEHVFMRDMNTGKVGKYPYAFLAIFPNLVEVSAEEAECVDCWKTPEPEPVADVTFDQPVEVRSRTRRSVTLTDPDEPKDNNDGE